MNSSTRRTAFVTGGGRGIGTAIVRSLADAGYNVVFTYSSSEEQAKSLVVKMEQAGKKVSAIKMNVADEQQTQAVIEQVGSQYGSIDVIVNNAGVFKTRDFSEVSSADFDWMMNINFRGAFLTVLYARSFLPTGARIITIGSVVADTAPAKGSTIYAASKSALQGLTRGLARDLGEKDITVNLIQPGAVDTDMNPADAPLADVIRSRMAIPKYGEPRDIAALVTFLASEEAKYITGSIFNIDGGFTA